MGRHGRKARHPGRTDHLRLSGRVRRAADRFRHCLHQAERKRRESVLHERQFHEVAQPDQSREGVQGEVASGQLFRLGARARCQRRPHHGHHPRRGARHHRRLHRRQRCLAGCLAGCRGDAVPWREGFRVRGRLARSRHHVGAGPDSRWAGAGPDDVTHGRVADDGGDGRHQAAACRVGRQQGEGDLLRRHRQQRLRHGQGPSFGSELVGLHRRRGVRRSSRGHRRRPRESRSEDCLEVSVDGEGHVARTGDESRRHRRSLLPHHRSVREVRHDVQWCNVHSAANELAGQVRRPGQRLDPVARLSGPDRIRQVDHQVSEHQALPGRSVGRPASESAKSGESRCRCWM